MYLKIVTLLLVWIGVACGASWEFTGNFSASTINSNQWTYRPIEFSTFDILGGWLGANYWSAKVSGSILNGSVDLVTGSAYIGIDSVPFSFLTYFQDSYNLSVDISAGQNFADLNVVASTGYVGTAYISLEETTPNGTLVNTLSLKWATPIIETGITWAQTDVDSSDGTLNYVTYNGTDSNSNTKVSITFLISSVAGILNQNVQISPKSLESVVAISGYPYKNAANSLSLVIGVGTGGVNGTLSGDTIYASGSNVYFSLSDKVSVGGSLVGASISGYSNGNIDEQVDISSFKSQLQGRYNSDWTFNLVKVTFPAGADNIVYDPAVGSGNSPLSSSSSSASALAVSFLFFVFALLAAML